MRVIKFGGKSLADIDRFSFLAEKLSKQNLENTIIVVSAMGDTTSKLLKMTQALTSKDSKREQDMLLTSGERVSAALMSMALQKQGLKAQSFTGSQAGILTSGPHTDADIKELKPFRVKECLDKGIIPVIAGFQGVDPNLKDITTLGRGGSDLTAVALASHFKGRVEFYKSIGGVFTCDPNLCETAMPIKKLSHKFLEDLSAWGGSVIHEKAASLALREQVHLDFINDTSFELITSTDNKNYKGDNFCVSTLDSIITLTVTETQIPKAVEILNSELSHENSKPNYKVLASAFDSTSSRFMIKSEVEDQPEIIEKIINSKHLDILKTDLIGISCVFLNEPSSNKISGLFKSVENISVKRLLETSNRYTFFIDKKDKEKFINLSHDFLINL